MLFTVGNNMKMKTDEGKNTIEEKKPQIEGKKYFQTFLEVE